MLVQGTIPIKSVTTNIGTTDATTAVKMFLQEYPEASVESIDGVFVRGVCKCGAPIYQQDTFYIHDPETGAYQCGECNQKKEV